MNWSLFVEGVGDIPKIKLDANSLFLFDNLPKEAFDVIYIQNWPLFVIRLPIWEHSKAEYYLQYNPQSRVVRRVIKHETDNPVNFSLIDNKYMNLVESGDIVNLYKTQTIIKQIKAKYGW